MRTLTVQLEDVTYLQLEAETGGAPGSMNAIVSAALRDWLDRLVADQADRRRTALAIVPRKRKATDEDEEPEEPEEPEDSDSVEGGGASRQIAIRSPTSGGVWHGPVRIGNRWQVRGSPRTSDVDFVAMLAVHVHGDGWITVQRQRQSVLAWAEHSSTAHWAQDPAYRPNPWILVWRVVGTTVTPWEQS